MFCFLNLRPRFVDPSDYTVLCSPIPDSTLVVHKDQVIDGIGVEKPTCTVIYDEYLWEYEEEPMAKDDLFLSTPHPLFSDIFCDPNIFYFPCENSFPDVSTSNHS